MIDVIEIRYEENRSYILKQLFYFYYIIMLFLLFYNINVVQFYCLLLSLEFERKSY